MALAASRGEDRLAFLQAMKGVSARLGLSLDAQTERQGQEGTDIAPLGTENHLHLIRCGGASHHGAHKVENSSSGSRAISNSARKKRVKFVPLCVQTALGPGITSERLMKVNHFVSRPQSRYPCKSGFRGNHGLVPRS